MCEYGDQEKGCLHGDAEEDKKEEKEKEDGEE